MKAARWSSFPSALKADFYGLVMEHPMQCPSRLNLQTSMQGLGILLMRTFSCLGPVPSFGQDQLACSGEPQRLGRAVQMGAGRAAMAHQVARHGSRWRGGREVSALPIAFSPCLS
jgi:hypothetical protein